MRRKSARAPIDDASSDLASAAKGVMIVLVTDLHSDESPLFAVVHEFAIQIRRYYDHFHCCYWRLLFYYCCSSVKAAHCGCNPYRQILRPALIRALAQDSPSINISASQGNTDLISRPMDKGIDEQAPLLINEFIVSGDDDAVIL